METELEVKTFMAPNLKTRTFKLNTPKKECYPWPMLDQTLTDHNSMDQKMDKQKLLLQLLIAEFAEQIIKIKIYLFNYTYLFYFIYFINKI